MWIIHTSPRPPCLSISISVSPDTRAIALQASRHTAFGQWQSFYSIICWKEQVYLHRISRDEARREDAAAAYLLTLFTRVIAILHGDFRCSLLLALCATAVQRWKCLLVRAYCRTLFDAGLKKKKLISRKISRARVTNVGRPVGVDQCWLDEIKVSIDSRTVIVAGCYRHIDRYCNAFLI